MRRDTEGQNTTRRAAPEAGKSAPSQRKSAGKAKAPAKRTAQGKVAQGGATQGKSRQAGAETLNKAMVDRASDWTREGEGESVPSAAPSEAPSPSEYFQQVMMDPAATVAEKLRAATYLDAIQRRGGRGGEAGIASLTRAEIRAEIDRIRAVLADHPVDGVG